MLTSNICQGKISNMIVHCFQRVKDVFGLQLVVVFFCRHSDKLLRSFGNIIGALDDLLSDQLDV